MSEMCSVCIVRAQRDDDDFLPCSPACFWAALSACEQRVLDEAREAVETLDPLLDVKKHKGGYDCCGCDTPDQLLYDALAAIDALRENKK